VDRLAIERGARFERRVADFLGGEPVPQSGSGWAAKGDVVAGFLVQAKSEKGRSWAQTRRQLKDAIDDAVGTGRPAALVVEDPEDGGTYFVARLTDVASAFSDGVTMNVQESDGQSRRRTADVPGLLRGEDE
jgi:hypothetical protein